MRIIAEAKPKSPYGWQSKKTWQELFDIANEVGDIISVHTNPLWDGSLDLIREARSQTDKPLLAKGIHPRDEDIEQARAAGADLVLVVGRFVAAHVDVCLFEPYTLDQLRELPPEAQAVWNSRDLRRNGALKREPFRAAREVFPGTLYQASNIKSLTDIDPTASGVIIGQHLPEMRDDLLRMRTEGLL